MRALTQTQQTLNAVEGCMFQKAPLGGGVALLTKQPANKRRQYLVIVIKELSSIR